jgi:NDP-sugar pyrophosphorylase family protein
VQHLAGETAKYTTSRSQRHARVSAHYFSNGTKLTLADHGASASQKSFYLSFYRKLKNAALGTGGALVNALPLLDEEFLVLYGDSYLPTDYGAIAASFRRPQSVLGTLSAAAFQLRRGSPQRRTATVGNPSPQLIHPIGLSSS